MKKKKRYLDKQYLELKKWFKKNVHTKNLRTYKKVMIFGLIIVGVTAALNYKKPAHAYYDGYYYDDGGNDAGRVLGLGLGGAAVGGMVGGGKGAAIGGAAGLGLGLLTSRRRPPNPYRDLDKMHSRLRKLENRLSRTTSERRRVRLQNKIQELRGRITRLEARLGGRR